MERGSGEYYDSEGQRKGFRGTAENSKTRLCMRYGPDLRLRGGAVGVWPSCGWKVLPGYPPPRSPFPVISWQQGHCRFGDKCNFAHGEAELRDFRGPRGGGVGDRNGAGMGPQGGYYQRQQPGGYQPAGRPGPYQQQGPPMSEHEIWVASGCPVQGPGGWTQYQVRRSDPDRFGVAGDGGT